MGARSSDDRDASVGRIFSIMGEKHAERRVLETEKEYKARVVSAGDNIQIASGVAPHGLRIPRSLIGTRGGGISARDPRDRRTTRLEANGERRCTSVYPGEHRRARTTRDVGASTALRVAQEWFGKDSPSTRTPLSPSSRPSTATPSLARCGKNNCPRS